MKEQKLIHEGLITESLPNGMFRVRLDNEDLIRGYISGRIRRSLIRILPGDRVKIEKRYNSKLKKKIQETYFLPRNRFQIKVRSEKYENKSFRS
uniref:Translational initiation factor IF-1 n=1 Tax=Speirantha gardenii TaxID=203835 RepID=A0A7M1YA64_9ASPA|nr:Translational initiation factor IF-1 [Speirantha gardenii]QOS48748.1 Translational initiation factor IF-1 [Speirantha gardenii]WAW80147.1 translation initiation factor 1 [Speirantha gardenii]WAW82024.1 translation initiation factor 1 [Speirantha gardenii]